MNINLNAKNVAIIAIIGLLLFSVVATAMYFVTSGDNGEDEGFWKPSTDSHVEIQDAVTDQNALSEDENEIEDADVAPEIDETEGDIPDASTDEQSQTTITIDLSEREYPLTNTPTRILVRSKLPSSNAFWNADMSGDPNTYVSSNPTYPVLEDAEVRVYQDIPNLDITNYKTSGTTSDAGYTGSLDLESQSFSSYDGEDGKMYIVVESEHLASSIGKVGVKTSVPDSRNKIVGVSVIPDTYSFSTILTKQDASDSGFLSWLTAGGTDEITIESMRPCAYSSSWGWNLASIVNAPKIDIYLSTKSNGDWKQMSFVTTEAVDSNNNLHVDLRPQILTAEQGYTGTTKFDMEDTGDQTFYVKFAHTYSDDEVYKISYTVSPSSVSEPTFEKVN